MASPDLVIFDEYVNTTATELLAYNINLFNAATNGGIVLVNTAHQGDYADSAHYQKIDGLVRRRDINGSATPSEKSLVQLMDTSVKVAAGTPPIDISPAFFTWIQKDPGEAGVIIGKQLADDMLADFVNTALLAYVVKMKNVATNYYDATAIGDGKADFSVLNSTRSKLGDRADSVVCWVMHSKSMFDLYGKAIANTQLLFNVSNVRISQDPVSGARFIVTDSPSLADTGPVYFIAGLTPNALVIGRNNDFKTISVDQAGGENIKTLYQAEWTFNLGLKGFQWDKSNGGPSPSNAALGTHTNWDVYASSIKDLAGVLAKVL
jgi:hypothetical protein